MSLWKLLTAAYNAAGDSARVRIDPATSSLQVVDYDHHEIHSGSHFEIVGNVNLSVNNVLDIQITTPNTDKWAHLSTVLSVESETNIYIYENVTINTAGTSVTPLNNNRNSVNTSGLTFATITNTSVANANADTAVAGATQLANLIIGAGKDAGSDSRGREIILKQNEDYSIRFIANSAGYVNYNLQWYEHTSHN